VRSIKGVEKLRVASYFYSDVRRKLPPEIPILRAKMNLHENTKPLQAADPVGYDGTKLRKSVDKITEDNDKGRVEG
jgi:hypothetical protein